MRPIASSDLIGGLRIARAEGDCLFTESGAAYTDLFCGAGTVFMGHANPAVVAAVQQQLQRVWIAGVLPTEVGERARTSVEGLLPPTHRLAGFYSTGMEAAEFALRFARVTTARSGVVGFAGSMHGKSMATAFLGWDNEHVRMPDFERLPSGASSDAQRLDRLASVLAPGRIAAVFLELLQASSGGRRASASFVRSVARLCAEHGTLLVIDEILTGFYRTGGCFLSQDYDVTPDIVLIGKAIGNGFPVSGVVVNRQYPVDGRMLAGSTFAGNPIAAAAVIATLNQMAMIDMSAAVARIEATVQATLATTDQAGVVLRGKGALWVLELEGNAVTESAVRRIIEAGVLVSPAGRCIRLLPPATISPQRLEHACAVIRDACLSSLAETAATA